jgi:DNA-binding MarR family transcriptional regulator
MYLHSRVITPILDGMGRKLLNEIRQTKPFRSLAEEAHLNLARTAAVLEHRIAEVLREHGITPTQYNVLRILRGAGEKGLCRNDVRDRLVAQVPDATRLLDRMMEMGLVSRVRDAEDKRFVTARITERGMELLATLDRPVDDAHRQTFAHLDDSELRTLITLLEKAREGTAGN